MRGRSSHSIRKKVAGRTQEGSSRLSTRNCRGSGNAVAEPCSHRVVGGTSPSQRDLRCRGQAVGAFTFARYFPRHSGGANLVPGQRRNSPTSRSARSEALLPSVCPESLGPGDSWRVEYQRRTQLSNATLHCAFHNASHRRVGVHRGLSWAESQRLECRLCPSLGGTRCTGSSTNFSDEGCST